MTAAAWQPYPDAHEVLAELRERGIGVAVISNIGWDLRPVFRAHGLDAHVDAYVLSYEHGVQKPAPELFAATCDALAVAPGTSSWWATTGARTPGPPKSAARCTSWTTCRRRSAPTDCAPC